MPITIDKMQKPQIDETEEIETRLALLESLIQTKNKEIEAYQQQVVDYNRLKDDFMSSQHKLIALQAEFDKLSEENKTLREQIKSTAGNTEKEQRKSYSTSKLNILKHKSCQTVDDGFQAFTYRGQNGAAGFGEGDSSASINKDEGESVGSEIRSTEKDFASELVKDVTAAASEIAREQYLATMVYEKTSGLYYDYKTGFYFDAERSLFYDGSRLVANPQF